MSPPNLTDPCLSRQQLEAYSRGHMPSQQAEACEEHLGHCSACQVVLSELFEAGCQPDWLTSSRPTSNAGPSTEDARQSTLGGAHQLWQNLAEPPPSPPQSPPLDAMPEMIGRYRIEHVLGDGGFGRVYLAYDEKLKRKVALKVPHLTALRSQVHWDLMLAEAQTVAALDHPGIVPIYDVASTDELPLFLVSKLIVGQTLADRLSAASLAPLEAASLILRVADALHYAHAQGVIHRDIKPQNILLDHEGQVYLSDFGLAWRGTEESRLFPAAGTPFYMSPEQLAGNSAGIDQRSDIYSLGKVLQESLGALQSPRRTQSQKSPALLFPTSPRQNHLPSQLSAHSSEVCNRSTIEYPANVPSALIAICQRATATEPTARYQELGELRGDLRHLLKEPTAVGSPPWSAALAIVTALLACGVIASGLWYLQRPSAEASAAAKAVHELLNCQLPALAECSQALPLRSPSAVALLREKLTTGDDQERWRATLGLLPVVRSLVPTAADEMVGGSVETATSVIPVLLPYAEQLTNAMWQTFEDSAQATSRLNAACFLSAAAANDPRWQNPALTDQLLTDLQAESASDWQLRLGTLIYQRKVLLEGLRRKLEMDPGQAPPHSDSKLYSFWESLVEDDLPGSVELMLCCPDEVFQSIARRLGRSNPQLLVLLREHVARQPSGVQLSLADHRRRHAAALCLFKLGHPEDYWPMWRGQSDPSSLALQLSIFGNEPLSPALFVQRLRTSDGIKPVSAMPTNYMAALFTHKLSERRNLLLALTTEQSQKYLEHADQFIAEVDQLYRLDADPCVHMLAAQILRHANQPLPELDQSTHRATPGRGWYTNSLGECMIVLQANPSVGYRFGISSCEVQRQHFEEFLQDTHYAWPGNRLDKSAADVSVQMRCAQGQLSWYDCAAFCNWLSRREGLEECYLPNNDGQYAAGMSTKPDVLQLSGYRLPVVSEWHVAACGGAFAHWSMGQAEYVKHAYLWDFSNARGTPQPVGQLRPNYLGLFDIHGNVSEWTMNVERGVVLSSSVVDGQQFVHAGGCARATDLKAVSLEEFASLACQDRSQLTGLRLARTLTEAKP